MSDLTPEAGEVIFTARIDAKAAVAEAEAQGAAIGDALGKGAGKTFEERLGVKNLSKLGSKLSSTGRELTFLSLPIAGAVEEGFKKGLERDTLARSTAAFINTLAGGKGVTAQILEGYADTISKKYAIPTTDVLEAMRVGAQRGVPTGQLQQYADTVAKAALITKDSSEEIAKGVAGVMNTYGISFDHASEVTGKLTVASKLSGVSVSTMADTLHYADAVAKDYGVSLDDLLTATVETSKAGVPAQVVFQQLRQTMTQLDGSTAKTTKFWRQFGYENEAAAIKSKGLHGVMQLITEAAAKQDKTLKELGVSSRAIAIVAKIGADSNEQWDAAAKQIGNYKGEQDKLLAAAQDSPQQKLKKAMNDLNIELAKGAEKHLPELVHAVEDLAHGAETLLGWFDKLPKGLQETVIVGLLLGGPVLIAVGALTKAVTGTVEMVSLATGAFRKEAVAAEQAGTGGAAAASRLAAANLRVAETAGVATAAEERLAAASAAGGKASAVRDIENAAMSGGGGAVGKAGKLATLAKVGKVTGIGAAGIALGYGIDHIPTGGGKNVGDRISGWTTDLLHNFADGGVVMPRSGGTIGRIGEAGKAEAVIPLDRLDSMMGGKGGETHIHVHGISDPHAFAIQVGSILDQQTRMTTGRRRY